MSSDVDNLVPFPGGGAPDKAGATPAGRMMGLVRELLAEGEHEQWAHWTLYFLNTVFPWSDDGTGTREVKPIAMEELVEYINRWARQANTPYAQLTEAEKNSDREWADKVLDRIQPVIVGMGAREAELMAAMKALLGDNELLLKVATHHELAHGATCHWRPASATVTG